MNKLLVITRAVISQEGPRRAAFLAARLGESVGELRFLLENNVCFVKNQESDEWHLLDPTPQDKAFDLDTIGNFFNEHEFMEGEPDI
jgi:hypothetical protein